MFARKARVLFSIARTTLLGYREDIHCHLLNDAVFVNNDGAVFTCCHYRPISFGSLYRNDLRRIWHRSALLVFVRWLDRHKRLHCLPHCSVLSPEDKRRPQTGVLDYPVKVEVLYGTFCNLACIMCPQDHGSKMLMDPEVLRRHIEWDKVGSEVVLTGGELMAMKGAKDFYYWLTCTAGKKVNVDTNGTTLNGEWIDLLTNGAGAVMVSVNAATKETHERVNRGSSFDRVIRNVRALVASKTANGSDIRTIFRFTMVPENVEEVPDAIALADRLGFDCMNFGSDSGLVPYLESRPELRESIKAKVNAVVGPSLRLRLDLHRLRSAGLIG